MSSISQERKEAVLRKLLPPNNKSVSEISKLECISKSALYTWLKNLKSEGKAVPTKKSTSDNWSAETKFMTVVAISGMNSEELSSYCREHGLYVDQVLSWKSACIDGTRTDAEKKRLEKVESKADKSRIKSLEKELKRKEKALAETAALLVLRKKLNAYYLEEEEAL